jgi:hypothetical protein
MSPLNQTTVNLKDISFGKPSQTSFMSKRSSLAGGDESSNLFRSATRGERVTKQGSSAVRKAARESLSRTATFKLESKSQSVIRHQDSGSSKGRQQVRERRGIPLDLNRDITVSASSNRPESVTSASTKRKSMTNLNDKRTSTLVDLQSTAKLSMPKSDAK